MKKAGPPSDRVLQDHRRPVVEARRVVAEAVDAAGQRREDRRAGRQEEVDAQMDRAPLRVLVPTSPERLALVDQPRLVVAPDRGRRSRLPHARQDLRRQRRCVGGRRRAFDLRAADGKVEHDRPREVGGDDRPDRRRGFATATRRRPARADRAAGRRPRGRRIPADAAARSAASRAPPTPGPPSP